MRRSVLWRCLRNSSWIERPWIKDGTSQDPRVLRTLRVGVRRESRRHRGKRLVSCLFSFEPRKLDEFSSGNVLLCRDIAWAFCIGTFDYSNAKRLGVLSNWCTWLLLMADIFVLWNKLYKFINYVASLLRFWSVTFPICIVQFIYSRHLCMQIL